MSRPEGPGDAPDRGRPHARRGEKARRHSREPRQILAEVIKSHYRSRAGARARKSDSRRPRLRLQDWHLIEELSVGDADYVLLCRSRVQKSGLESLTARERDVVRHASSGASNKEIAHRMGIGASTVGVLFWRACRKLGAADRDDLLRTFTSRPR
jgi:DNA-binding CsgD family transcriptional regulator